MTDGVAISRPPSCSHNIEAELAGCEEVSEAFSEIMTDIWSRAWCETQKIPNFAVKGKKHFIIFILR